jgi:hypothetical protein
MERDRERQDQLARDQAVLDQQAISNMFAARAAGGSVGGAPRIAQEAPTQTAPSTSSVLDSALFAGEQTDRGEGLIEQPDLGRFARPRTEFVVDPDYEEVTIGDQTFSFITREAEERRAAQAAQRDAAAAAALRQEQRDHDISMKVLEDEFRQNRDSVLHGYNVAMENLKHSNALNRISGTGEDRISYADIEKAVMNTALRGYKVYDEYGNVTGERSFTTEEARNMLLMLEDAFGFIGDSDPIPGSLGASARPGPTRDLANAFSGSRQQNNLNIMLNAPRGPSNVAPRQQTSSAGAAPVGSYMNAPASFTNDMISQGPLFSGEPPGATLERQAAARLERIKRLLRTGNMQEVLSAGVGR